MCAAFKGVLPVAGTAPDFRTGVGFRNAAIAAWFPSAAVLAAKCGRTGSRYGNGRWRTLGLAVAHN